MSTEAISSSSSAAKRNLESARTNYNNVHKTASANEVNALSNLTGSDGAYIKTPILNVLNTLNNPATAES